jgi:hypothetical protein
MTMTERVIQTLADEWGVSEHELQTVMQRSQSVRERVEQLPGGVEQIDLGRLHSDAKLVLIGERIQR